jgi:hypothetical protein
MPLAVGSGDALRVCASNRRTLIFAQTLHAQGSSVINHYWFWLRSGRHAHTALSLPSLIRTERGAASFASRLAASGKNTSTRQAARSARNRPPAFAISWLSHRSRVVANPLIKPNLSTTILLKPINGAKSAPLDASLFNKISLLKAWRVFPAARPLRCCLHEQAAWTPAQGGFQLHLRRVHPAAFGRGQKLFETETR